MRTLLVLVSAKLVLLRDRTNCFKPNEHFFQKAESSLDMMTQKFWNNLGHNILEFYNFLAQVQSALRKMKLDN